MLSIKSRLFDAKIRHFKILKKEDNPFNFFLKLFKFDNQIIKKKKRNQI